jgi:hypothetical protein
LRRSARSASLVLPRLRGCSIKSPVTVPVN